MTMRQTFSVIAAAVIVLTATSSAFAQAREAVAKRAASGEKLGIALIPVDQTGQNEWAKPLMSAAFEDALLTAGRFRVLTRTELNAVKSEQILSASGMIDPAKAVALGKGLAANYVLVVRQLALDSQKQTSAVNTATKRVLGFGRDRTTYNVNLQAQVIDAETTEVVQSESFNEVIEFSTTIVQGQPTSTDPKVTAPYRAALDKFAKSFTSKIASAVPLDALVALASGGRIAITGGSEVGTREGAEFEIIEEGEPIRVGGQIIGYDSKTIGRAKVNKVEPKLAWVQLLKTFDDSGKEDPSPVVAKVKQGMLARMVPQ